MVHVGKKNRKKPKEDSEAQGLRGLEEDISCTKSIAYKLNPTRISEELFNR